MEICKTENYNSPPTGEILAMQTPGILGLGKDLYGRVALVYYTDELVRVDSSMNVIAST